MDLIVEMVNRSSEIWIWNGMPWKVLTIGARYGSYSMKFYCQHSSELYYHYFPHDGGLHADTVSGQVTIISARSD